MRATTSQRSICGIIFALMPLLGIYSIGVPFLSLGQTLFFTIVVYFIISGNRFKSPIFVGFSVYAVLITLLNILTTPNIIVGDEIHDILAWFCFLLTIWGAISYADYEHFYKAFMVFGCISVGFFYIQYLLSLVGVRISGLIPSLPLSVDVDFQSMVEKQVSASRLSGLFMEPAHYAENMSLFLSFVMLKASSNKKAIFWGAIISITIFLSQSAMGIVLVLFIWAWWFFKRYKFKLSSIIYVAIFIAVLVPFVMTSDIIDQLLLRFSADYVSGASGEGHFSTYIRTVRGYIPFLESDFLHKLIGNGFGALSSFIKANPGTGFLAITDLIPNWINGMSYLLLSSGIIGSLLYLSNGQKLFKGNSELGKVVIILSFLLLLSSDSLFLMYHYFFIAFFEKVNQWRVLKSQTTFNIA